MGGFWSDFGLQVGPKIHQKSVQEGIKNKMRFWMDFGWLLEGFWVDFGSKLEAKLEPSCDQNEGKRSLKTRSKKDAQKSWSKEPFGKKV